MEGEGVRHKNYRQLTPKFSHCTKWLIKYKHVVIIENSRRVWCLILIIPSLRCLQQKDCHKFETAWGTECDPSLKMKPQMENSGLNCHIAHCESSVRWTELLVFAEFCLDSLGSVWLVLQVSPLLGQFVFSSDWTLFSSHHLLPHAHARIWIGTLCCVARIVRRPY